MIPVQLLPFQALTLDGDRHHPDDDNNAKVSSNTTSKNLSENNHNNNKKPKTTTKTTTDDDELEALKAGDVWALGLTIFALLYGRLPFGNGRRKLNEFDGISDLLEHISDVNQPIEFPERGAFVDDEHQQQEGEIIPPGVLRALQLMLAKDPAARCTAAEANNNWLGLHEVLAARQREAEVREALALRQREEDAMNQELERMGASQAGDDGEENEFDSGEPFAMMTKSNKNNKQTRNYNDSDDDDHDDRNNNNQHYAHSTSGAAIGAQHNVTLMHISQNTMPPGNNFNTASGANNNHLLTQVSINSSLPSSPHACGGLGGGGFAAAVIPDDNTNNNKNENNNNNNSNNDLPFTPKTLQSQSVAATSTISRLRRKVKAPSPPGPTSLDRSNDEEDGDAEEKGVVAKNDTDGFSPLLVTRTVRNNSSPSGYNTNNNSSSAKTALNSRTIAPKSNNPYVVAGNDDDDDEKDRLYYE